MNLKILEKHRFIMYLCLLTSKSVKLLETYLGVLIIQESK